MNSYKIQVFGWESVFHTYQVDKEGVEVINQILKDNETQDLSEVWEEIEYELDLVGKEQLSICRPNLNLERLSFIVYDADGEEDNYFFGEDILEHTDIDPNYSSDHDYHVVEPKEMGGAVIVVHEENKGGIFEFYVESEDTPQAEDFSYTVGFIENDLWVWEYVSEIFYKGNLCKPEEFLDNDGKSKNVYMYWIWQTKFLIYL